MYLKHPLKRPLSVNTDIGIGFDVGIDITIGFNVYINIGINFPVFYRGPVSGVYYLWEALAVHGEFCR